MGSYLNRIVDKKLGPVGNKILEYLEEHQRSSVDEIERGIHVTQGDFLPMLGVLENLGYVTYEMEITRTSPDVHYEAKYTRVV